MMVSEHSDLIPGRPQRVLLLSGPRTASNLLIRLLSKQARFVQSDYYFFKSKTALNNDVDAHSNSEVPHDLRDRAHADLQKSFNKMQESIEKAEREGKIPFIKEHVVLISNPSIDSPAVYPCDPSFWTLLMLGETKPRLCTNPTILPDDFLEAWRPMFIIRHPALVLSSLLRAMTKLGNSGTSIKLAMFERFNAMVSRPQRALYDWYVARNAQRKDQPTVLVIDADDVMYNRPVVEKLCNFAGFDVETLQYEWEIRTSEELGELNPMDRIFLSTLSESRGVVGGKGSKGLDLVTERKKWVEEFGEDWAALLTSGVEGALGDYEHLYKHRLQAE